MEIGEYYRYQAKARRLKMFSDVTDVVAGKASLYEAVIRPWLPADRNAPIYEVACGPGIFLLWAKSRGYTNVSGSDSSDVQIELAKKGELNVKLADSIDEMRKMEDRSLDCIVGIDFYEHLPKEVFLDFLFEASRVLRPGGRLVLRGPNGDSPVVGRALYNDITHVTAHTSIAFTALLNMAGFQNVEFRDETMASISRSRWLFAPLSWIAQRLAKIFIYLATGERIRYFSASFFIAAQKS